MTAGETARRPAGGDTRDAAERGRRAARAAWGVFFCAPGLLAAGGAATKLAFNAERTAPEWIVAVACVMLLVANVAAVRARAVWAALWLRRGGLVLAAVSLSASLAIAEVVLQRLLAAPPAVVEGTIYAPDPELGFTHRPGSSCRHTLGRIFDVTYHIDGEGLRRSGARRTPADTADGKRRVALVVGCSQTFGHGVADAEAWPSQLEVALGPGWRVANGAVAAYGPPQMLLRARRLAALLRPERILVGVASFQGVRFGDDPQFNRMIGDFGLRLPELERRADGSVGVARMVPGDVAAREEVTLFDHVGRSGSKPFRSQLYLLAKKVLLDGTATAWRVARGEPAPAEPTFSETDRAHWAVVLEGFAALERECGAEVVLVVLPEPKEKGKPSHDAFRAFVAAEATRLGLESWDVGEDVARAMGRRSVALQPFYEPHYNATAHAAIAQAVAARWRDAADGESTAPRVTGPLVPAGP